MKKNIIFIIIVISSFVMTTITHAYLVFGNYDGINVTGGGGVEDFLGQHGPAGTRRDSYLSWLGGNILIDSIEIYARMNAGSSAHIHMYLYDSLLDEPIATLEADEEIGVAGNYTFSPTEPLTLAAGLYDLVIESDFVAVTSMSWFNSLELTGGEYSELTGTEWGPWQGGGDSGTYRVYGTVVPEPGTIALFLLGISCLFARKKIKHG